MFSFIRVAVVTVSLHIHSNAMETLTKTHPYAQWLLYIYVYVQSIKFHISSQSFLDSFSFSHCHDLNDWFPPHHIDPGTERQSGSNILQCKFPSISHSSVFSLHGLGCQL